MPSTRACWLTRLSCGVARIGTGCTWPHAGHVACPSTGLPQRLQNISRPPPATPPYRTVYVPGAGKVPRKWRLARLLYCLVLMKIPARQVVPLALLLFVAAFIGCRAVNKAKEYA